MWRTSKKLQSPPRPFSSLAKGLGGGVLDWAWGFVVVAWEGVCCFLFLCVGCFGGLNVFSFFLFGGETGIVFGCFWGGLKIRFGCLDKVGAYLL